MSTGAGVSTPAAAREGRSGPVLREAKMHLVTPAAPVAARVVSSERCTASSKAAGFVRHVALDVSGTPLAGNFIAGQSFGVLPPGVDAAGKPHKPRLYSIASPTAGEDGRGTVLATTVKRTIDEHRDTHRLFLGVASNFLCDAQVGDTVMVSGPNGKRFVLPAAAAAHDYLFIATGTGIAPFRGMVRDLLGAGGTGGTGGTGGARGTGAAERGSRVVLVMGVAYATDLLYHDEFEGLARAHADFTYLTAVSRERGTDGGRGMYVDDRLAAERERLAPLLESERTLVYLCGVAGMEVGVLRRLVEIVPRDRLGQYVEATEATLAGVKDWERRMIHREVKPTRRVFMEVY